MFSSGPSDRRVPAGEMDAPRFGFTPAGRHGVRCPFTVPDEAFMVMALVAGGLDHINGAVRYPAVFDGL
ncbi:MAG: hypothetical protein IID36_01775 [Planctomycetes bacterium]|nr:hypothetical protein [Planctomycetota bacterium]